MATVNFECGHCHNLMAVGEEHLGQQVRCPHCEQVVLAPAPSPAPTQAPAVETLFRDENESIFTPPEAGGEDLFDSAPLPQIDMPPEPAFPHLAPSAAAEQAPAPPPPAEAGQPTQTYHGPQFPPPVPPTEVASPDGDAAAPAPSPRIEPRPRPSRGSGWVIAIVVVPLISYSILATIAVILLLSQIRNATHPLEMVPDIEGDHKNGATRSKRSAVDFPMPDPEQPVPPQLCVRLAQPPGTVAVGDLEVTPERVERGRAAWVIGQRSESFPEDALILRLKLRNRSRDVTFYPMDRYFVRSWSKRPGDPKPYTMLEMGKRRFYGGALDWSRKEEFIRGQDVDKELKPGEAMTTFVCTNPDEHAVKALDDYEGPLVWHIQLRRGLVNWTTKDGVERDDSATAVVGVEFSAADVKAAD
jgi:hypothetical protein